MQAANWLINNSSLYREEGITLNPNWLNNNSNGLSPVGESDTQQHEHQSENIDYDQVPVDDEDNWSEDEVEIPAGVTDTMLTATDFMTDKERQQILNVVPAEGSTPKCFQR